MEKCKIITQSRDRYLAAWLTELEDVPEMKSFSELLPDVVVQYHRQYPPESDVVFVEERIIRLA